MNSYRKELEERMMELRRDINSYKKYGVANPQHLDNAIDEFTEIEIQLEELEYE